MSGLIEIPGLREAIEKEQVAREIAFMGLNGYIAGVEVKQMTPRHYLILSGVKNPFITGEKLTAENIPQSVAIFLWVVSPKHRQLETFWDRLAQRRFIRSVRKVNALKAIREITEYLDEAFMDIGGGSSSDGSAKNYASWIAHLVAIIAKEFGWSERDILDIPLRRLGQYLKCIRMMNNPAAIMFNPSDKIISNWLREVNAAKGKAVSNG